MKYNYIIFFLIKIKKECFGNMHDLSKFETRK